ncbi:uncharacterized protein YALI1_F07055g [Yarrowia lipolytica]|uniref:Uncharacterized protein n=1 Tax=Yarrowia lipolytica TaxID=4952 RepID=A0A1D8NLY7_YARLL|nr:hypothetical protein YALI1_F07055g [Yarrowia lipolytica]
MLDICDHDCDHDCDYFLLPAGICVGSWLGLCRMRQEKRGTSVPVIFTPVSIVSLYQSAVLYQSVSVTVQLHNLNSGIRMVTAEWWW